MLGKRTRGRKRLQMLRDITVKDFVTLKIEAGARRVCHKPAIWQKTKEKICEQNE